MVPSAPTPPVNEDCALTAAAEQRAKTPALVAANAVDAMEVETHEVAASSMKLEAMLVTVEAFDVHNTPERLTASIARALRGMKSEDPGVKDVDFVLKSMTTVLSSDMRKNATCSVTEPLEKMLKDEEHFHKTQANARAADERLTVLNVTYSSVLTLLLHPDAVLSARAPLAKFAQVRYRNSFEKLTLKLRLAYQRGLLPDEALPGVLASFLCIDLGDSRELDDTGLPNIFKAVPILRKMSTDRLCFHSRLTIYCGCLHVAFDDVAAAPPPPSQSAWQCVRAADICDLLLKDPTNLLDTMDQLVTKTGVLLMDAAPCPKEQVDAIKAALAVRLKPWQHLDEARNSRLRDAADVPADEFLRVIWRIIQDTRGRVTANIAGKEVVQDFMSPAALAKTSAQLTALWEDGRIARVCLNKYRSLPSERGISGHTLLMHIRLACFRVVRLAYTLLLRKAGGTDEVKGLCDSYGEMMQLLASAAQALNPRLVAPAVAKETFIERKVLETSVKKYERKSKDTRVLSSLDHVRSTTDTMGADVKLLLSMFADQGRKFEDLDVRITATETPKKRITHEAACGTEDEGVEADRNVRPKFFESSSTPTASTPAMQMRPVGNADQTPEPARLIGYLGRRLHGGDGEDKGTGVKVAELGMELSELTLTPSALGSESRAKGAPHPSVAPADSPASVPRHTPAQASRFRPTPTHSASRLSGMQQQAHASTAKKGHLNQHNSAAAVKAAHPPPRSTPDRGASTAAIAPMPQPRKPAAMGMPPAAASPVPNDAKQVPASVPVSRSKIPVPGTSPAPGAKPAGTPGSRGGCNSVQGPGRK